MRCGRLRHVAEKAVTQVVRLISGPEGTTYVHVPEAGEAGLPYILTVPEDVVTELGRPEHIRLTLEVADG